MSEISYIPEWLKALMEIEPDEKRPLIREVDGDRVDGDALGVTYFGKDNGRDVMEVTSFSNRLRQIYDIYKNEGMRQAYRSIVDKVKDYLWTHEWFVEHKGRPKDFYQEAELEADLLDSFSDTNPMGVIMHKIRLEKNDQSGLFTHLKRKYDVGKAYRRLKRQYGEDYIDGMAYMTKQVLGLEHLQPEADYGFLDSQPVMRAGICSDKPLGKGIIDLVKDYAGRKIMDYSSMFAETLNPKKFALEAE